MLNQPGDSLFIDEESNVCNSNYLQSWCDSNSIKEWY